MSDSIFAEIYTVVRMVPEGRVATYGQIARLVGRPRHARQVGYALAALGNHEGEHEGEHDVPWHRVINAKGEISGRAHADYEDYQRLLLEQEGVEFGLCGRIRLKDFLWEE